MVPSLKTLKSFLDEEQAKQARALMRGELDPMEFESVRSWVSQCYNPPSWQEQVERALNEVLDGWGIEAIWGVEDELWPIAVYINMGDTYNTTLLYDYRSQTWRVTTWGDFVEKNEKYIRC